MKPLFAALGLTLALTHQAQADGRSQLLANVERELPYYVKGVDASELSTQQLASLNLVLHGNRSDGDKVRSAKSIIGGQHSLFGSFDFGFIEKN